MRLLEVGSKMEKLKNMNKKTIIIAVCCLVGVVVLGVVGYAVLAKETEEEKLIRLLNEMGTDFYENYYYDQLGKTDEEREKFLALYTDKGIKVNLDNLGRYNSKVNEDKIAEFVNSETNEECDKIETKIIIYPKESFGKTDYELEAVLECGFDEEE